VFAAGVDLLRIRRIDRHAGERPVRQIAFGLFEFPAVLLKAIPARKSGDVQSLLAVAAHRFLLVRCRYIFETVITPSQVESQPVSGVSNLIA
jgi:hypothetical protein